MPVGTVLKDRFMRIIFIIALVAQILLSASMPTLAKDSVSEAQRYLNILGYDAGVVDGLYGKKTELALENFYSERGQIDNKVFNQDDLDAILKLGFSNPAAVKSPSYEILKILPERPDKFDVRPCNYEDNFSFSDIKKILLQNDYEFIDAFSENEEGFLTINDRLNQFLSELWATPTEQNADVVTKLFNALFTENYALSPKDNTHADSLPVKEALITMMYIFSVLEENNLIAPEEKLTFLSEIQKRFEGIQDATSWGFDMSSCEIGTDLFGCQNHTYSHQHVRTLYGAIFNSSKDFQMGKKLYKFAIDDLSSEGALWREASRSKWSWRYYAHALGHLLSIAEVYRLNGEDLYSYRSEVSGFTIHDAIAFYFRAIQNPKLMWQYSSKLEGVKGREDYQNYKSSEYLNQLITDTELAGTKNWYYIYRNQFPDHPNTILGDTLIPVFKKQIYSSNNSGFLAQCIYKSAFQETAFSLSSPINAPELNESKLYTSDELSYFIKDFKRDVIIQRNDLEISSDNSFSTLIGGDILFTVDGILFSTWLDIEFGRANQNDGDIKFLWEIDEGGNGFLARLHEGFAETKKVCGTFKDVPEGSLTIYFRAPNNDLLKKQDCYLKTLETKVPRYDFEVLTSLIESSSQLLNLIVKSKPSFEKLVNMVPEFDYENAEPTDKVSRFDRSEKSMRSKIKCLQSEFQKRGMPNVLSESDVSVLSEAFKGDNKQKNKSSLIKAGLSKETVAQNKKYLLRLVNFTASVDAFCAKPIR